MRPQRKRLLAVLASLGLAALGAGPAAARVNLFAADGADPRTPVETLEGRTRVFAPIARVKTLGAVPLQDGRNLRTRGTGFMVSPCLLVTNFHAVFGHPAEPFTSAGPQVEVVFPVEGGTVASLGEPVLWGGVASGGVDDWAVVRLQQCLGARSDVGWFDLDGGGEPELPGYSLDTAGYPSDRTGLSAHSGCRIHAVTADHAALNDCANRPGASGSPLFYYSGGVPAVVAIQRGQRGMADEVFPAYSSDRANTAVTAQRILSYADVAALIEADREAWPELNPIARRPVLPPDPAAPPVVELQSSVPVTETAAPVVAPVPAP